MLKVLQEFYVGCQGNERARTKGLHENDNGLAAFDKDCGNGRDKRQDDGHIDGKLCKGSGRLVRHLARFRTSIVDSDFLGGIATQKCGNQKGQEDVGYEQGMQEKA